MGATEFTQDKQLTAAPFNIHYSTPDVSACVCTTHSGSIKKSKEHNYLRCQLRPSSHLERRVTQFALSHFTQQLRSINASSPINEMKREFLQERKQIRRRNEGSNTASVKSMTVLKSLHSFWSCGTIAKCEFFLIRALMLPSGLCRALTPSVWQRQMSNVF